MHIEPLNWIEPHQLFEAFAHEPFALFLDSATAAPGADAAIHGRWSFIALDPFETLTLTSQANDNPFVILADKLKQYALPASDSDLPPFTGGAAGFFGYDLAHHLEKLPPARAPYARDDQDLPQLTLGFYDTVLAFDMVARRALLISNGLPESDPAARAHRAKIHAVALRKRITEARPANKIPAAPKPRAVTSNFTRPAYEQAVTRIINYIRAGDIFQANLTQRFEAHLQDDETPYELYLRLRAASPAPFSAFFNFGTGALLSSSPERFLMCRNGEVETKPIKGTRPRGATPQEDKRLASDLLASTKDRAENVMIVDLLRNDLSRSCANHTVKVEKLCALESFANVHHLVSTVHGELKPATTHLDLLTRAFPGGSITGAPKLRAMEIIAELEPTTRGPYCGSIGYLGFDGTMDTSIAIRTMIVKGNRITFQAGGGIVADSDPVAEYEESLTKAKSMLQILGGEVQP
ncbi:MAG: aminodeoxychorismate synthase component I [Parvibaculum sp.]|nr:aminodeoxychorismate synthase component I [Parvibaculum sp.]